MSTGRKIMCAIALAVVVLLIAAGITLYVINAKNGSRNPRATATSSAPTAAASWSSPNEDLQQSASPSYRSAAPEVAASPSSTAVEAPEPSATSAQPSSAPATAPPAEHAPTAAPTSPAAHPTPSGARNTDLVVPPGPSGTPQWKQLNITTPDEAIALVSRVEFKNNPDFTYAGFPNQDGSFEVVVRSRSLQKGGGSGTVGRYRVTRDGNFTLIS